MLCLFKLSFTFSASERGKNIPGFSCTCVYSVFCFFVFFKVNLSCSQKRKSEDLNEEATNGQTEVKKEEENVEEVKQFYLPAMF